MHGFIDLQRDSNMGSCAYDLDSLALCAGFIIGGWVPITYYELED